MVSCLKIVSQNADDHAALADAATQWTGSVYRNHKGGSRLVFLFESVNNTEVPIAATPDWTLVGDMKVRDSH